MTPSADREPQEYARAVVRRPGRPRPRTRRRAGSASRPVPVPPSRPPPRPRCRPRPRRPGHCGAPSRSPNRPPDRCRTPGERRISCGGWRGRPPRSRRGCGPAARCGGWPARCRGRGPGAAAWRPVCRMIRAYPSAAPVTAPSNRPSTPRISGTESSAATKCISDVPGLAKHTSTPVRTRVRISDCAPFMGGLSVVAVRADRQG